MGAYELINYFDVWGNAKDGWEINNQCIEECDIQIAVNATPKEICTYLMKQGFLNTDDMRKVAVEEDWTGNIEIFARKGMKPVYLLRRLDYDICRR